mmetsp:Transcript_30093/g.82675  ORF Transcript_30093/g.82675 Transcript_30093/m.82675 type:complete len:417 (-) Transcript_30093:92-1342(-)
MNFTGSRASPLRASPSARGCLARTSATSKKPSKTWMTSASNVTWATCPDAKRTCARPEHVFGRLEDGRAFAIRGPLLFSEGLVSCVSSSSGGPSIQDARMRKCAHVSKCPSSETTIAEAQLPLSGIQSSATPRRTATLNPVSHLDANCLGNVAGNRKAIASSASSSLLSPEANARSSSADSAICRKGIAMLKAMASRVALRSSGAMQATTAPAGTSATSSASAMALPSKPSVDRASTSRSPGGSEMFATTPWVRTLVANPTSRPSAPKGEAESVKMPAPTHETAESRPAMRGKAARLPGPSAAMASTVTGAAARSAWTLNSAETKDCLGPQRHPRVARAPKAASAGSTRNVLSSSTASRGAGRSASTNRRRNPGHPLRSAVVKTSGGAPCRTMARPVACNVAVPQPAPPPSGGTPA